MRPRQAAALAGIGLDTWRTIERGYKARRGVDPAAAGSYQPDRLTVRKVAAALRWAPDQALRWAGHEEPVRTAPQAVMSPLRLELTTLIQTMPEDRVELLLNVARTMRNPVASPDPNTTYREQEVPPPRDGLDKHALRGDDDNDGISLA